MCANGGQGRDVPGTWSASIEWLVGRLAPAFPALRFAELRYRIKSWNRLDMCVEDALAAIDAAGGERTLLVGFSMGGLVSVRAAEHPTVVAVLGLAPWLPDQLDLSPLVGKRLDVIHGASTAGCRASRASARRSRAAGSSAPAASASRGRTRRSQAASTGWPCGRAPAGR